MEKFINLIDELIFTYPNLSDIHLTENENIVVREFGILKKVEEKTEKIFFKDFFENFLNEENKKQFKNEKSFDFCISKEKNELRMHVYKASGKNCISIRLLKNIEDIKLNDETIIDEISEIESGLVIISGTSGSGKSTLLAKIIDRINTTRKKHIITLEDPIEYKITSKKSLIHQREVGKDVENFHKGVIDALREDMNVLFIGEMRDEKTMRAALFAAETGHLVLTTLHNKNASDTIGRIVHTLKDDREVRDILASQLRIVISQKLYFYDKKLLILQEIMKNTPPISRLIRDGKDEQIKSYIEMNTKGMHTMKQHAMQVARKNKMSHKEIEKLLKYIKL